jgi:hypothetical protein
MPSSRPGEWGITGEDLVERRPELFDIRRRTKFVVSLCLLFSNATDKTGYRKFAIAGDARPRLALMCARALPTVVFLKDSELGIGPLRPPLIQRIQTYGNRNRKRNWIGLQLKN